MTDTTDAASSDQTTPHPQTDETDNENSREALLELLTEWISTDTWNKSEEILQAHKEQMLTDEALEALEELHSSLLSNANEDEHEYITKTIQQHRAIVEKARAESIDAAYAELLKPSPLTQALQNLPDELRDAIQAMMEVRSPAELLEQIPQHPILLTSQATDAIDALLDAMQQIGEEDAVRHIEARYATLKQVIQDLSKPNPLIEALHALPDELSEAIQAMISVKSSSELLEQVNKHPILLTQETTTAIDNLLEALRQTGQIEIVEHIEERYKTLKQLIERVETEVSPIPDDLAKLLTDWINTKTWSESREILKVNAESLL